MLWPKSSEGISSTYTQSGSVVYLLLYGFFCFSGWGGLRALDSVRVTGNFFVAWSQETASEPEPKGCTREVLTAVKGEKERAVQIYPISKGSIHTRLLFLCVTFTCTSKLTLFPVQWQLPHYSISNNLLTLGFPQRNSPHTFWPTACLWLSCWWPPNDSLCYSWQQEGNKGIKTPFMDSCVLSEHHKRVFMLLFFLKAAKIGKDSTQSD